jgi:tetratricopeptide (TPR) repeat protein
MHKMIQIQNRRQENIIPVQTIRDRQEASRHRSWILVVATVSLVLVGCWDYFQLATAHTGLDPEIEEITEKLVKNPNSVELLILRGQVYRSNGKYIESLQDLERAWLLDRENRTVLLQRAMTLSALERNKDAEAALDYFLQEKTDTKRVFALAERAIIRARTGRVEAAIVDFTSAIQLQPTIELYLTRGNLQESKKMFDEAAAGYQDGLTKLGDAILLKKSLIRVQIAQKRYDEALALTNEELARSSVKTPWYLLLAEIFAFKGQPEATRIAHEKALSEANRVLEKRSTAVQLLARAKVYEAMGRKEDAKRDLRLAVKKAPRFDEADDLLKKLEKQ